MIPGPMARVCEQCRGELTRLARFCPRCGTPVGTGVLKGTMIVLAVVIVLALAMFLVAAPHAVLVVPGP